MKKSRLLIFQIAMAVLGLVVLIALLVMPLKEGRAQNLRLIEIYSDAFILYVYVSSIIFFYGLYKCILLIENIKTQTFISEDSVKKIKTIKYSSAIMGILIGLAAAYIKINHHPADDPAGFIGLCLIGITICMIAIRISITIQSKIIKKINPLNENNS